jgi:two-component system cell cycle response regulator
MKTQKILIIEDNKLNLKLIRTILLISNFKVYEAENAEIGFQIIEEHHPDIILMDIQLPGMDGLTATRRIKASEAYKDIPVIALTAKAMDGDEQKALAAGCDGYIVKPINTQGFLSTLNKCMQNNIQNRPNPPIKNLPTETQKVDKLDHRIKNIEGAFSQRRKILIVDDEPLNVQLMESQLTEYSYDTIAAYCGEDALEIVEKELPDLIILDVVMPGIDGFEVIRAIRANKRTADIPIILCTVLNSKEERIRGLNIGADEFLNKPIMFEELVARVRSLIRIKAYQDQIKGYETMRDTIVSSHNEAEKTDTNGDEDKEDNESDALDKLKSRFENALHTALTDPLTTLYNKNYFFHFLEKELQRVKRNKIPLSLMFIDIDDLKTINEKHGQSVVDIILKDIGILLTKSIRDVDTAARYGENVFAIILPYTDDTGASIVSERLRSKIASLSYTYPGSEKNYLTTVSIGVVSCQNITLDKTRMVQIAEELIQESKAKGKNKVTLKNADLEIFLNECYDNCDKIIGNASKADA